MLAAPVGAYTRYAYEIFNDDEWADALSGMRMWMSQDAVLHGGAVLRENGRTWNAQISMTPWETQEEMNERVLDWSQRQDQRNLNSIEFHRATAAGRIQSGQQWEYMYPEETTVPRQIALPAITPPAANVQLNQPLAVHVPASFTIAPREAPQSQLGRQQRVQSENEEMKDVIDLTNDDAPSAAAASNALPTAAPPASGPHFGMNAAPAAWLRDQRVLHVQRNAPVFQSATSIFAAQMQSTENERRRIEQEQTNAQARLNALNQQQQANEMQHDAQMKQREAERKQRWLNAPLVPKDRIRYHEGANFENKPRPRVERLPGGPVGCDQDELCPVNCCERERATEPTSVQDCAGKATTSKMGERYERVYGLREGYCEQFQCECCAPRSYNPVDNEKNCKRGWCFCKANKDGLCWACHNWRFKGERTGVVAMIRKFQPDDPKYKYSIG